MATCYAAVVFQKGRRSADHRRSASNRSFAINHASVFPPSFMHSDQSPFNFAREITKHRIHGRMHPQRRSNEEQQRLLRRELPGRKVAELLKLAARMVPAHAR